MTTDPYRSPTEPSPEPTSPSPVASRLPVLLTLAAVWLGTVALGHLTSADRSNAGAADSSKTGTCSTGGCCPSMTSIGLPESVLRSTLPADSRE